MVRLALLLTLGFVVAPAGRIGKRGWVIGRWQECSVSCGTGVQQRKVFCSSSKNPFRSGPYKSRFDLTERSCRGFRKPYVDRKCNTQPCPGWITSMWGVCSTSCGKGKQHRNVTCFYHGTIAKDQLCNLNTKPNNEVTCYNGQCNSGIPAFKDSQHSGPYRPRWYPGSWTSCSKSCGAGRQERKVTCMSQDMRSGGWMMLNDHDCHDQGTPRTQRACNTQLCEDGSKTQAAMYKWKFGKFTECSRPCLEGVRQRELLCVDESEKRASWNMCDARQRPAVITEKCNLGPCKPTWEIGRYSPCTATCGQLGLQLRDVHCVHERNESDGSVSKEVLGPEKCAAKQLRTERQCPPVNCPPSWEAQKWTQCSKTCGEGEQRRLVTCIQTLASGQKREHYPPDECAHLPKPASLQLCNAKCKVALRTQQHSYRDNSRKKPQARKVENLKASGQMKVSDGYALKIKCPLRGAKPKPADIVWTKNGRIIVGSRTGRIRISDRGKLRISKFQAHDDGVYSCFVKNKIYGTIRLIYKFRRGTNKQRTTEQAKTMHDIMKPTQPAPQRETTPATSYTTRLPNSSPPVRETGAVPKDYTSMKHFTPLGTAPKTASLLESSEMLGRLQWHTSAWSACPSTCGSVGSYQIRNVKCLTKYGNSSNLPLSDQHCLEAGLTKPNQGKICGTGPCPRWKTEIWTLCSDSRCESYHTAMQTRETFCSFDNGTVTPNSLCSVSSRPATNKTCVNSNCTAVWTSTDWSTCTKSCGAGVQMRTIGCYWSGTTKPAQDACQGRDRPTIIRSCNDMPCRPGSAGMAGCMDSSRYCPVVQTMGFCNNAIYKVKCCLTCLAKRGYTKKSDDD